MKGLSLDEWLAKQQHKSTKGDEITVYILNWLYNRHTMIHTKNKLWLTVLPTGANFNYAAACQMGSLLYMMNHVYGLLHPKSPPPSQLLQPAMPSQVVTINIPAPATPHQQPTTAVNNEPIVPAESNESSLLSPTVNTENTTSGYMISSMTDRENDATTSSKLPQSVHPFWRTQREKMLSCQPPMMLKHQKQKVRNRMPRINQIATL